MDNISVRARHFKVGSLTAYSSSPTLLYKISNGLRVMNVRSIICRAAASLCNATFTDTSFSESAI